MMAFVKGEATVKLRREKPETNHSMALDFLKRVRFDVCMGDFLCKLSESRTDVGWIEPDKHISCAVLSLYKNRYLLSTLLIYNESEFEPLF